MALLEAVFLASVVSVNCCLVKEHRIYIQPFLFLESRLVMNLKTPQPLSYSCKPVRIPHNHFYAVWNRNALAGGDGSLKAHFLPVSTSGEEHQNASFRSLYTCAIDPLYITASPVPQL